jgi:SAM-dependent methyltransferase
MRLGYVVRSSRTMMRSPRSGAERIRGRIDRRQDLRELTALGGPRREHYTVAEDWAPALHDIIGAPWPCPEAEPFGEVWDAVLADLASAGLRVGRASYGGWNDGDRAQAAAIWCVVAHSRPGIVVETGVAHGLTSRVILEGLKRNGAGHLWSIDLPAVDPALHREIGIAVRADLRSRWSYTPGTSRERLPGLVRKLKRVDLFVHDSLHTARNMGFELDTVWPALTAGGIAVVDDVDHSLGFRRFIDRAAPEAWLTARHVTGAGLWGAAVKARPGGTAGTASGGAGEEMRERRHQRIEEGVVGEIARVIREVAPDRSRLLQVQPGRGRQTLVFRDQLAGAERPVIYDEEDKRDPAVSSQTDFYKVDLEAAALPAADGEFDLVVWNRDLVTVKNLVPAMREVRRVLRPGGILVVAAPNLAALHNRVLLMTGRQPTTLHIGNGDHVRGFAIGPMTQFLTRGLDYRLVSVTGVGLAPVSAGVVPGPLRGLSHTAVWALRKP